MSPLLVSPQSGDLERVRKDAFLDNMHHCVYVRLRAQEFQLFEQLLPSFIDSGS